MMHGAYNVKLSCVTYSVADLTDYMFTVIPNICDEIVLVALQCATKFSHKYYVLI